MTDKKTDAAKVKKVLVIKLCCIGDIVQTTPALRAFKEAGLEVHLLCSGWVKDIAALVPFIDRVHVMDSGSILSVISTLLRLRSEKFGLAVNFHRDLRSYIFMTLSGAKVRAGFEWKGAARFLDRAFKFDADQHETIRYLTVARGLGYAADKEYTQLSVDAVVLPGAEGRLKIGVFPAGGSNPGMVVTAKRWPAEKFNALIRMFEEKNASVYVFGSGGDKPIVEDAVKGTGAKIILTGGIREFASYAAGLDAFIASDTGPLHIAAALGIPTVGIFGPTSPEHFGARGIRSVNIYEKKICQKSPCLEPATVHNREFMNCTDNVCIKSITPENIMEAVESLLNKR
jgi:ADP-heptose:LPS heptosyltransferase